MASEAEMLIFSSLQALTPVWRAKCWLGFGSESGGSIPAPTKGTESLQHSPEMGDPKASSALRGSLGNCTGGQAEDQPSLQLWAVLVGCMEEEEMRWCLIKGLQGQKEKTKKPGACYPLTFNFSNWHCCSTVLDTLYPTRY